MKQRLRYPSLSVRPSVQRGAWPSGSEQIERSTSGQFVSAGRTTFMSETNSTTSTTSHVRTSEPRPASNGSGNGAPAAISRHVLEFERPLAKLEQQIHELEALQHTKQVDYTKELRQLRSNYTSLLRKT